VLTTIIEHTTNHCGSGLAREEALPGAIIFRLAIKNPEVSPPGFLFFTAAISG
jgi:hypothetical protein